MKPLFFEMIAMLELDEHGGYSIGMTDTLDDALRYAHGEMALNPEVRCVNIKQSGHYVGCATRERCAIS